MSEREAVDFLYKHGDLTYSAAFAAIKLLTENGFQITRGAAPASAAEPVKVKPLEWRNGFRPGNLVASHPFGENYVIATDHDDIRSMSRRFSNVDDAKKAVQADFEARIRSAILTVDT